MRLVAPMAASIYDITHPEGAKVEKGRPCMIIESMKMMIDIMAPQDGIVKKIFVQVGEVVAEGTPLMEIV